MPVMEDLERKLLEHVGHKLVVQPYQEGDDKIALWCLSPEMHAVNEADPIGAKKRLFVADLDSQST